MRGYLAALSLAFIGLFVALWAFLVVDFADVLPSPEQMTVAQNALLTSCDLGDFDVLGNSEAIADVIPSRIGAGVRVLALTGATPVETYYIAKQLLKCPNRPKSVLVIFNTAALGNDPLFPMPQKTNFWAEAVMIPSLNFEEILNYSKQFNNTLITGPQSLFDLDYRIKALLCSLKFPPLFELDLQHYAHLVLHDRRQLRADRKAFYAQTLLDDGHHFYGMRAESAGYLRDSQGNLTLDHDAFRVDDRISPFEDFYLRRTIRELTKAGIRVYYILPPMNQSSADHYPPDLISIYQNYLAKLQSSEAGFQLIGDGFPIWNPIFFGDQFHLNLRGSLIFSDDIRKTLIAAGRSDVTYADADLKTANLYDDANAGPVFWKPATNEDGSIVPVDDITIPELAYPPHAQVWLYQEPVQPPFAAGYGIPAPSLDLAANSNYALAIFVKNINAEQASLLLDWPGDFTGAVNWSYAEHRISYTGSASQLNSGVLICPGGWVELFLSVKTGPEPVSYQGPKISLSPMKGASAYLYNVTLEKGLWPTNYCSIQPKEYRVVTPVG